MKILKKLLFYISIIMGIIVLYFSIALLESSITEWTLRPKTYDVSYPVSITDGTISEIEKQAKKIVIEEYEYENAYLGAILISTDTDDGFNNLTDDMIKFTYCHNLGKGILYRHDRFALLNVYVDLRTKQITQIEIYGNDQLGALRKIESYPEMAEIRENLYKYCDNEDLIIKPYTIKNTYISILYYGITFTSFYDIQMQNGSIVKVKQDKYNQFYIEQ